MKTSRVCAPDRMQRELAETIPKVDVFCKPGIGPAKDFPGLELGA